MPSRCAWQRHDIEECTVDKYPRLALTTDDPTQCIEMWVGNSNEYWRRADRDNLRNIDHEVVNTFVDVVRCCYLDPMSSTLGRILSDSFINYTSGRADLVLTVVQGIDSIVRTGAAPTPIGMFSNWVKLIDYGIEPGVASDCAGVLRGTVHWLTQAKTVHPWDSALVFMAAQLAHNAGAVQDVKALAVDCAMDTNGERLTLRTMTIIEHTQEGALWWKTVNTQRGGSPEAPLPQMPVARECIARRERSEQAWWRYAAEMQRTQEYVWALNWIGALISPSRDEIFSTNGLL